MPGRAIVGLVVGLATAASVSSAVGSPPARMRAYPVGEGTTAVDERRDPWVAVTDDTVAPLLTPTQRRVHRVRRVAVDYDADGVSDVAWMVANRSQMGVLVRLGATGRKVLAYRADGQWSDQGLYRAGRRAIEIEFPESTSVLLSSESGRPLVYYPREGGGETLHDGVDAPGTRYRRLVGGGGAFASVRRILRFTGLRGPVGIDERPLHVKESHHVDDEFGCGDRWQSV